MKRLRVDCFWIPHSHGGRRFGPHPGLRLGIRWQKYIQEGLDIYRDIQIDEISFDSSTNQGIADLLLMSDVPSEWTRNGELVEFLEGFKVVAVGYIEEVLDRP